MLRTYGPYPPAGCSRGKESVYRLRGSTEGKMKFKAVIFDMDGTVLNTVDDLCDSLNYAMEQFGHKCDYTPEEVKFFAGGGVGTTVVRALAMEKGAKLEDLEFIGVDGAPPEDPAAREILRVFRAWYSDHCNIKTGPYDGIPELITQLRSAGIRTAVVSNKMDAAVQVLAQEQFPGLFDVCVGQRPGIPHKPAPDMVNEAMDALGIPDRAQAVYIGDSEVDMQTAANSGLDCICVAWGFRGRKFLEAHGAGIIVDSPEETARLLLT